MVNEQTILFNGKSYTLSRSGWVETNSRLRVPMNTARKLDKLAALAFDKGARHDSNTLLTQVSNARADNQLLRAEQLVRQVLHADPNHIGASALLCGILRDRGMPQQAIDQTACVASSAYAPLRTSRAAALCDLEQWTNAAYELQPVLDAGGSKEVWSVARRIRMNQPVVHAMKPTTPQKSASIAPPAHVEQRKLGSELKHVTVHLHGTCMSNPGSGGYGVVLAFGTQRKEVTGGFRRTTNERMDITAAIIALENLKYRCDVTVYSDSQALVNAMSRGWVQSWRAKGWMRTKRQRATNVDLWTRLLDVSDRHKVEFVRITSDTDDLENIRSCFLAQQAAAQGDLPADSEYEHSEMARAASFNENSDSPATNVESRLQRGWKEIEQAEFTLAEVLQGLNARANGDFIYIVRYCRIPVYVGMTRDSVNNRMWHHVKQKSNVGAAVMADRSKEFIGWSVLVIRIEGEIEAAERSYIRQIRPPMNIEHNGNTQEHVTEVVRIFKRNYQPDSLSTYRRHKRRGARG